MSSFFSLTPWTSMYIKPNGNVYPCESVGWLDHEGYCVGNIEHDTIEKMWNHPAYKKMRLDVLETNNCAVQNGQSGLNIGCTYLQLRELYNLDINFYKEGTSSSGEFPLNLQTLYIERSNICNLTCVYCNSMSSSSWAKLNKETSIKRIPDDIYKTKLMPHFDNLKEINISGGEPVLDPFSEKMLDYLLDYNPEIQINMTTNLTYDFDNKITFFDKLSKFKKVPKIACSVDSKETLFETIRRNSSWPLVLNNLHRLKQYNFYQFFCIAVSVLNCFSLKSFHEFIINEGLADIDTVRYQPVCYPEHLSVRSLNTDKKIKLQYYLLIYAGFLKNKELAKTKNGKALDVWCNGGKILSKAIIDFIDKYLYTKEGNPEYRNTLLKIFSEKLLIDAKL